ncbi:MAG: hypothetical protein AAFQ37_03725 [Bacteroidota bacterium]
MRAVTTIDEKELRYNLPLDCSEFTYGQFIDFRAKEEQFLELAQEKDKVNEAATAMAEAVAQICGDEIKQLPFAVQGDDLTRFEKVKFKLGLADEISIIRLYAHILTITRRFAPKDKWNPKKLPIEIKFNFRGNKYKVNRRSAVRVMANKPLLTCEMIEVLEYHRRTEKEKKKRPQEASNLDFTMGLTQFAILCRRPGEKLPADEGERERWLTKRRKLIANVSAEDVFRVRFFLIAAFLNYSAENNTRSSGKVRRMSSFRGVLRSKPKGGK